MGLKGGSVKVAFVGSGYMAREHARAFQGLPDVELVGVCSRTSSSAAVFASEFRIPHVCDSVESLYSRTHADLVVIAVRELSMRSVAYAAFAYPWVLLLEKPVGHHLEEACDLLNEASRVQARAYVALNRRSYGSTRRATEILGESSGGPRLVCVNDQQDQIAAALSGQPPEVVRNYMYANSIHVIDYLRVFGRGSIQDVNAIVPWKSENPGFVVAHIAFESGDIGLYEGVWSGPGPWAVSVTDSDMRLEMRPLESLSLQRRGERTRATIEPDPLDSQFKPGLRHQAQCAVRAVRLGVAEGLTSLEDATASMHLCARIFGLA